jgi:hypothetical protein
MTMRLLGYICPKISADCPKCKKNVFGEGLAWVRNSIRFANYFNLMLFGNHLECYYCGSPVRILFKKGEYLAGVSDR